jgi:sarcosine oxidase subunit beta
LFLPDDEADLARFTADLELQAFYGIETRLLSPVEAGTVVPQLDPEGLVGAVFNPVAGVVTLDFVVQGFAQHATAHGAQLLQGCAVTRILAAGGRVSGVETAQGRVATDRVILAAGVCSGILAAGVGLHLPVEPERRYMFFTGEAPGFPAALPLTIDFGTGFYSHREGVGLVFGGREQSLEELAPVAARRVPALAELGVFSSWSVLYEMSPDRNALVGAAADPAGLVYATGFSGHGFQQGPVIGEHLARLALGLDPLFDLTRLGVERFAAGEARIELNVV